MVLKNFRSINLRINQRLTLSYLLIGFVLLIVLTVIFYYIFKNSLLDRTFDQLSSINILKKSHLEDYFKSHKKHISFITSLPAFQQAVQNIRKDKTDSLVHYFDAANNDFGYNDILVLNDNHKLIYSRSRNTPLKKLFLDKQNKDTMKKFITASSHEFTIRDFSRSVSESNVFLLFGYPVHINDSVSITLILQKTFENIEPLLYERTGMGKTGESYIVAKDKYMRSKSRFYPEKNPLSIKVNTLGVNQALEEKKDFQIIEDYRGIEVLSVFRKLDIRGLEWVILSEINLDEAMVPIYRIRNYIIISTIILFLLILELTYYFSRNISAPILNLRNIILQLSRGKLPEKPVQTDTKDEIGQMKKALNHLINGLRRTSEFAYEIGKGNFDTHFKPLSNDDMMGYSLISMRDQLIDLKNQEEKLRKQRAFALVEGQEEERKRISRELHDSIGQMLNATRMRIGMIKGQKKEKEDIKTIIDETIAEVRRMSNNLMPNVLLDFGLESALNRLVDDTSKYGEIPVNFNYTKEDEQSAANLSFDESICVYRIAQEGLNNILKYAEASEAQLYIYQSQHELSLFLQDNGKGFNIEKYLTEKKQANGIKNMQERAHLLNGTFTIDAVPGKGTTIKVKIPISKNNTHEAH